MKHPLRALRIPKQELQTILRAAKRTGKTFSALVREAAVERARDILDNAAEKRIKNAA